MEKRLKKGLFFTGIASFLFCFFTSKIAAQVIVNEVYPNPDTSEEEWAELWNTSVNSVDLNGWQLWDQLSSPSLAYQFKTATPLAAQAFLVVPLHSVLNNSGDGLVLKNPAGQSINTLNYPSSTKGKSWAKNPNDLTAIFESDPTPNEVNAAPTPSPTPTPAPSITPTPTPTPSPSTLSPILSEIMACPADSDEWVELANPHNSSINLNGFKLRDNKAQIFAFTNQEIEPLGFLAIELHNVLNNGGDSISLISPTNQVLDSFSYTTCDAELSWANRSDQWLQTEFITKDSANIFADTNQLIEEASTTLITSETNQSNPPSIALTSDFSYPLSVLRPKLDHEKLSFPSSENIIFGPVPKLEQGALSVIIGSLLLLIPGLIYVKNRQSHF